jgi:hypothetical protein
MDGWDRADGQEGCRGECLSDLRLTMAEMYTLCLIRAWTMARADHGSDTVWRVGMAQGALDDEAASEFESMLLVLSAAHRPLRIADLHAAYVTDDEVALISLLAVAQQADLDGTLATLRRWLPPAGVRIAIRSSVRFARGLMRQRLVLRTGDDILNGIPLEVTRTVGRDYRMSASLMH